MKKAKKKPAPQMPQVKLETEARVRVKVWTDNSELSNCLWALLYGLSDEFPGWSSGLNNYTVEAVIPERDVAKIEMYIQERQQSWVRDGFAAAPVPPPAARGGKVGEESNTCAVAKRRKKGRRRSRRAPTIAPSWKATPRPQS